MISQLTSALSVVTPINVAELERFKEFEYGLVCIIREYADISDISRRTLNRMTSALVYALTMCDPQASASSKRAEIRSQYELSAFGNERYFNNDFSHVFVADCNAGKSIMLYFLIKEIST